MFKTVKTIINNLFYKLFSILIRIPKGKIPLINFLSNYPQICIESLGKNFNLLQHFDTVLEWPQELKGFEDLYFLFSCTQLNMGIINLAFDEAAYLYKVIKGIKSANLVEIGRFKGGGTLLMAAAMDKNSYLRSYDLHVKMKEYFNGESMDKLLYYILEKYKLANRVKVIVGNSHKVETGKEPIDLIFIDGDHSYNGVRNDFLHWYKKIKFGGSILFHDATKTRPYVTYHEGVGKFVKEIEKEFEKYFYKIKEVGSMVHFVCRNSSSKEIL
jgi:predicted O-methyltransferase YrrM